MHIYIYYQRIATEGNAWKYFKRKNIYGTKPALTLVNYLGTPMGKRKKIYNIYIYITFYSEFETSIICQFCSVNACPHLYNLYYAIYNYYYTTSISF